MILPTAASSSIGAEFARHMANPDAWNEGTSEFEYWPERRWNGGSTAVKQFASVAEVLTQLPATEAAAERLFSIFVWLFNERRLRSDIDLVEAEMIIRMWQVYQPERQRLPIERCTRR